jgi:formate-dependent nitrite reductase membrane component NrfD
MSEEVRAAGTVGLAPDDADGPTYYGRPAVKEPVWIWSVPAYLFTGGVAGGAATVAGVAQVLAPDRLRWLVTRGRWVAAGGGALGTVFLIHDLGRPARFLNMLRVFRPSSAMSMGSWTLAGFAGAATTAAVAPVVLPGRGGRLVGNVGGLAAGLLGPVLGTYTGVLLGDTAVPVWVASRRQLPLLFAASALAGAGDVLELLGPDPDSEPVGRRVSTVAKTAELGAARALEAAATAEPEVGPALTQGVAGDLWRASTALTAAGLVVTNLPVGGRLRRLRRRVAALLGVVGGVLMRFALVRAGAASARDPRATFGPQRRRRSGPGGSRR